MKGTLKFDPNEYDYGPATTAIRSIVIEWSSVDWFEPSGAPDEELIRLFQDHNSLAHRAAPELFANQINVRVVSGGWSEFSAWCKRVRARADWDWKFSVLKKLSHEHSKARGWSLDAHAPQVPLGPPKPGDLFVRFNTTDGKAALVWHGLLPAPDLQTLGRSTTAESAQFYFEHARSDAFSSIQWQLTEKRGDLSGNPFIPLLQCYRLGGYPFSLDRDTVVVFRFTADGSALPRATLLSGRN